MNWSEGNNPDDENSIGSEFGLNVLFNGADEANDPTPGSVSGHLLHTYLGFSLNDYLSQG